MIRPIEVPEVDEGLCYDPDRARLGGLHEEMSVSQLFENGMSEVPMTDELFEALLTALDLSVNVCPGDEQVVTLRVQYRYDYDVA
jgi:hypothetical protein